MRKVETMVEDKGETKDLSADLFEGIQVRVKTIQSANGCNLQEDKVDKLKHCPTLAHTS
jgi:hypothetical protein